MLKTKQILEERKIHFSGQITMASAEVTINVGLVRESLQNPRNNSGLGIIGNVAQIFCHIFVTCPKNHSSKTKSEVDVFSGSLSRG